MPEVNQYGSLFQAFSNLQIAVAFLKANNYKEAQKSLLNSLKTEPNFANAIYLLSVCMEKEGKTELADQLKDRSFYLNPCFFRARNYEYERILIVLDEQSNNFVAQNSHSEIKERTIRRICTAKDYNTLEIIAKLFKTSDRNIMHEIFSFSLAELYNANLQHLSFNELGEETRRRHPSNNISVLLFAQRNYTECERMNERSLAEDANNPQTCFISSHILSKTNRYDMAVSAITKAIELRETSIGYFFHLFSLIMRFFPDKISDAKETLQKLLNLKNPRDYSCFFAKHQNIARSIIKFLSAKVDEINPKNKDWITYLEYLSDMTILGDVECERLFMKMGKLYPILGVETPVVEPEPELNEDIDEENPFMRRNLGRLLR